MTILRFDCVDFSFEDMIENIRAKNGGMEISEEMTDAAKEAYREGGKVLSLRSSVAAYKVADNSGGCVTLADAGGTLETLSMGGGADYLAPAEEAVVILSTAGGEITEMMERCGAEGEFLIMYYLDLFAVQALSEISEKVRARVESEAKARGLYIGPSMQPGSVEGWDVEGQRDLFHLGRGEEIGLTVNDSSLLVPHISNSTIIGIGAHYSPDAPKSMCGQCPRFDRCLWRKETIATPIR